MLPGAMGSTLIGMNNMNGVGMPANAGGQANLANMVNIGGMNNVYDVHEGEGKVPVCFRTLLVLCGTSGCALCSRRSKPSARRSLCFNNGTGYEPGQ